jgi:ABC-2 type transport system ATP-binding protein
MIMGLIRPDSGSISYRGQRLPQESFLSEVGYLPENPYLYDHLSLKELLAFCQRVSGLDAGLAVKRGQQLMEQLQLTSAQKRPLRTFSKGMLQRAGICFALLHEPSLIVFDEPMSGLDPVGRKMVFDLILELKEEGKTVFFCSHILSDVERLCDRIGLMSDGRLVRTFDKAEFLQESGATVHLVVPRLSDLQLSSLVPLVEKIGEEFDIQVLSVLPARLPDLASRLEQLGVAVCGTRSERISLEQLFMQTVKGSNR